MHVCIVTRVDTRSHVHTFVYIYNAHSDTISALSSLLEGPARGEAASIVGEEGGGALF